MNIQGDSDGMVSILGGDSTCHCKKKDHTNKHLILNDYRDFDLWILCALSPPPLPRCVRILFVEMDEEHSLQQKVTTKDELLAHVLDPAARRSSE
jgi:hypothetical protein